MLRAIELIERSQARSRPRGDRDSGEGDALRARAAAAGAVWLALAVAVMAAPETVREHSAAGYLFVTFAAGWTVWLTTLLRRLVRG
jgi:hypothetical protein